MNILKFDLTEKLINWMELGRVPDPVTRIGIRRLLRQRIASVDQGDCEANQQRLERLIEEFSLGPIALLPEKANEQHYEVPAELFELTLGKRNKYSCCFWPEGTNSLEQAENRALAETCTRAEIRDGQRILELGCGWGSLTLWLAEQYPNSQITAVSNSTSQREYIERKASELGIAGNLQILTCDMNDFDTNTQFDRVVSVEMFEHMRNYRMLLNRISSWLLPTGKLFVHIFCHRELAYEFQDKEASDWMSRYFFSGGIMPSDNLLSRFQDDMTLARRWRWNGCHYQKTCDAWLRNMDKNRQAIMGVFESTYGQVDSIRWFNRWRMFYMACSELFGFRGGNEWWVAHYLFENGTRPNSDTGRLSDASNWSTMDS